jgi:tyrosyl-tRNA synthetase
MFTFLPSEECRRLGSLKDAELNQAKERLAWEVTALIHGKEEADKSLAAARAAFRGDGDPAQLPTIVIERARLEAGIGVLDLFVEAGLVPSKNEARRLVQQGGASVNGQKVENEKQVFTIAALQDGAMILRAGKKRVARVISKDN